MARRIALVVRKRGDDYQPLGRDDLAIDPLAPHLAAVRGSLAVEKGAARAQFEFVHSRSEALRSPPVFQALRFSERFPYEVARRIEDAGDNQRALAGLGGCVTFCGHSSAPFFSTRSSVARVDNPRGGRTLLPRNGDSVRASPTRPSADPRRAGTAATAARPPA